MGGGAFANAVASGQPTLNTPRMTPAEYTLIKETYLSRLQTYFPDCHVACLIEAPEKTSYGDMDISIGCDKPVDFVHMASFVGAQGVIPNPQRCTLAVPKASQAQSHSAVAYQHVDLNRGMKVPSDNRVTTEEYAQIDIELVPKNALPWYTFYSSYGDLNAMLGRIVTPLGFTVTDRGLWLRMKELDAAKDIERAVVADEDGKMLLSDDPNKVMQFLGLSIEAYEAGFRTLDQFYEWLGACRLIQPESIRIRRDRADDRVREQKRKIYADFFFEWLPTHLPQMITEIDRDEQIDRVQELREQYLHEAVDFFSKREEYTRKHDAIVLTLNNAIASNLLRPLIAKHSGAASKKMPELVRAFRRWVRFTGAGQPVVGEVAVEDSASQLWRFLGDDGVTLRDEEGADEFVRVRWEEVKGLERQRAKG